jgi:pyruvate dehydrogenase E2 component (dihydrolipoamide acetyltransferase)
MAELVNMPRLSDTMEEGNIVGWQKKVGDKVSPGDVLAEVETDKATMELESYYDGVLLHISVPEGPVKVGALLGIIGKEGEDISALLSGDAKVTTQSDSSDVRAQTEPASDTNGKEKSQTVAQESTSNTNSDLRVKASPLAKSMAAEKGLDISTIIGSGEGGRIVKSDILAAAESQPAGSGSVISLANQLEERRVPASQIRKTIARRLSESKFSAPHFYVTTEIDMENAIKARESINAAGQNKISYNDLVIKAVAMAIRQHPDVNSSWMGDYIQFHSSINIGVAVAAPDGLKVPVVNNADMKSLSAISTEVRELAGKAKDKKLSLQEMQGNTFSISNLGMFDVESFTAIINPPDACILAVGGIVSKPVIKDGQVVPGNTMKVTLSSDHRVVDGVVAARFLQTLRQMLENPVFMLV